MNSNSKQHMKTTVDKLLASHKEIEKENALTKEEAETLHRCCVDVFSSREGKVVAKHMMKMCGIYKFPDLVFDPAQSAFKKGMCHMYLFFIKGQLPPKTLIEIENKEK